MAPYFLLTEQEIRQNGNGPAVDLSDSSQPAVYLSMGITRVLEQQSLDMTIWGSADGENWGDKPMAAFPQKFYCGAYSLMIDLAAHPEVKYLRAAWKVSRWGRGDQTPLFGVYVFVEGAAKPAIHAAVA